MAVIIVWDVWSRDLGVLLGKDTAAAAALYEAAGLHGPGFDVELIVEWAINVHAGPHSFAAVIQRAVGPPRSGWPRTPHMEISYYTADSPGDELEAPGGISRPPG